MVSRKLEIKKEIPYILHEVQNVFSFNMSTTNVPSTHCGLFEGSSPQENGYRGDFRVMAACNDDYVDRVNVGSRVEGPWLDRRICLGKP